MRISSQSLAQSSFMSYLCGAKKGRDGLCHQRTKNSDWASSPARVCQESNAQACPPAVLGWSAAINADTVQLTYPFKGHYNGFETPAVAKKQVSLDMSYYNWTPPLSSDIDSDEDSGVRCSSPLVYGEDNPIYGMEIYVPNRPGTDMGILRQIIGNFGGYANTEYFDETNVIMLSEETLHLLEQGIKDDVITQIEKQYNQSSTKMFNIQFTSELDFITWVKNRLEKFPDENTKKLLEKYEMV